MDFENLKERPPVVTRQYQPGKERWETQPAVRRGNAVGEVHQGGFPGRQSLNWLLWRGPGLIERRVQRPPACSALCQGGCRRSQHLAGQPLPPLAAPSSSLCTFSQTSSPLLGACTCSVSGCLCPLGPQALLIPCCPSASPSIEMRVGNRKTAISSGTAKVPRNLSTC